MYGWSCHPHRASGARYTWDPTQYFCTSWLLYYPVKAKLTSPFFTFWARSLSCLSHGAGRRPNIVYCRATVRTSQVWGRFLYLYFNVCERSVSHFGTAYLVPFIKEANSSWEIPYVSAATYHLPPALKSATPGCTPSKQGTSSTCSLSETALVVLFRLMGRQEQHHGPAQLFTHAGKVHHLLWGPGLHYLPENQALLQQRLEIGGQSAVILGHGLA